MDRRDTVPRRPVKKYARSSLFGLGDEDKPEGEDSMDIEEDPEELERQRRLEEQWRFDQDDVPPVGPEGADEQDGVLIDDYDPTYVMLVVYICSYC